MDWLFEIPRRRNWVLALIGINFLGSLYGFYWYAPQLAVTPWWQWIVVPDSPTASLFFTLALTGLALGRRWRWLEGLAAVNLMKYGLWTVAIFAQFAWVHGWLPAEGLLLGLSHAGMALESWLFLRVYRPGAAAGLLGAGWTLLNDVTDYLAGNLHPTLPDPAALPFAREAALVLSLVSILYFRAVAGGGLTPLADGRPVSLVGPPPARSRGR